MSMDNQFEATKNSRNAAMLADASEFARNLRTCEKGIQSLKTVMEGKYTGCAGARPLHQLCQQDQAAAEELPGPQA